MSLLSFKKSPTQRCEEQHTQWHAHASPDGDVSIVVIAGTLGGQIREVCAPLDGRTAFECERISVGTDGSISVRRNVVAAIRGVVSVGFKSYNCASTVAMVVLCIGVTSAVVSRFLPLTRGVTNAG